MSSDDDHQIIGWLRARITDGSEPTEALRERFCLLNDGQRVQELESLSSWLHDNSSLRKKAQLLQTARELNRVHLALRKVGR